MNPMVSKFGDKENSISAKTVILFPQVVLLPVCYADQSRERRAGYLGMLSLIGKGHVNK